MRRLRQARPRPALVVAVVALVAALAGTAVASDPVATTSAVKKKKVRQIAKKIADKRIDKAAPNLSVAEAESAGTVDGADTNNLVQAFATVEDGANPTIRNVGGKRADSVTVAHAAIGANYTWTFTGDFAGVDPNAVGVVSNTFDSDNFVWCAGNNDAGVITTTATTLTVRTFCSLNSANTITSEAHTVEVLIAD